MMKSNQLYKKAVDYMTVCFCASTLMAVIHFLSTDPQVSKENLLL